jgi:hypothetical protein
MSTSGEGEEKLLVLPDGRTLAYSDAGNASSSTLVIYLHGMFTVGDAKRPPPVMLEKGAHFVAPTDASWLG